MFTQGMEADAFRGPDELFLIENLLGVWLEREGV